MIKEQELFRTGPQFPDSYNESDFSIVALIKGNWAVAVEYELEPRATATITFTVKDVEPFSQTLQGDIGLNLPSMPAGDPAMKAFRLPERFGEKPQAALISFKAVTGTTSGNIPAAFELVALGIGDQVSESASTNQTKLQTAEMNALLVKASSQGVQSLYPFITVPMRPNMTFDRAPLAVGIKKINVTPDALAPEGVFEYTFVSTDKFSRWNAGFYRNAKVFRKGKITRITLRQNTVQFDELVFKGLNPTPPPNSKHWRIKKGGGFPPGIYKIQVTAFSNADAGKESGKSAYRSRPVKIK